MVTTAELRTIKHLADQDEDALAWLASLVEEVSYEEGDVVTKEGDPADHMIFVLEGGFQFFMHLHGQRIFFDAWYAGDITGVLPFSRIKSYNGDGIAAANTRVAQLHRDYLLEFVRRMPVACGRLVEQMTDRVREASRNDARLDRMFALGKLSAGLAHELNNPAAAAKRATEDLKRRMVELPDLALRVSEHGLKKEQLDRARAALDSSVAPPPGTESAIARSDREDQLVSWLRDRGVERPFGVAEGLAEQGVTPEALDRLSDHVPGEALTDVVLWAERLLGADRLLGEIERAATKVHDLVASVKKYARLDQPLERQPVDVHAALDSTLTMLGHAIRTREIRIVRDYCDDLPEIVGHPGELDQVWTNLLDNAIDAIADGGQIEITTRRDGVVACVRISDDGEGIPDDVKPRIFEAFFSTKPPGEGTGLGLDIVNRIIRRHDGTISVESEPGRTTFEVCLPQSN